MIFSFARLHKYAVLANIALRGRLNDMTQKTKFAAAVALLAFLSSSALAQSTQSSAKELAPIPGADIAYPYHLVPTTNIWTQLLLDTATGRVWQVQFSLNNDAPTGRWAINESSLLPQGAIPKNGRFALHPTQNMFTFLLLDRQDSRVWQLQWSVDPEKRGIVRSITQEK